VTLFVPKTSKRSAFFVPDTWCQCWQLKACRM
jgi:hypothetical protein